MIMRKKYWYLSAFEDSIFCVKGFNSDIIGSNSSFKTWDDCADYESEQSIPDYIAMQSYILYRPDKASYAIAIPMGPAVMNKIATEYVKYTK